ncbi:hypothetical protein SDC9_156251 [bioreactor metagenome]|uniref:Uncharacterized protein n=1 Tax=bioreactor metagenome TaxID=1076179 RepID=A0A645F921_9ZZZZ
MASAASRYRGVVAPFKAMSPIKSAGVVASWNKYQETAHKSNEKAITHLRPNLSAIAPPRKVVTNPAMAFTVNMPATAVSEVFSFWLT